MALVPAKGDKWRHLFFRWEDGQEHFNIEATGRGMATPPDQHYRTGRYLVSPEVEKRGRLLKPLDMRQSLATFLAERACYCLEFGAHRDAVEAMAWASTLDPENGLYLKTAKRYYNQWLRTLNCRKPPHFPHIVIMSVEKGRFAPTVPIEFELAVNRLEAIECLLKDKQHERNLWEPLRRGEWPAPVPVEATVHMDKSCAKTIRFQYSNG